MSKEVKWLKKTGKDFSFLLSRLFSANLLKYFDMMSRNKRKQGVTLKNVISFYLTQIFFPVISLPTTSIVDWIRWGGRTVRTKKDIIIVPYHISLIIILCLYVIHIDRCLIIFWGWHVVNEDIKSSIMTFFSWIT